MADNAIKEPERVESNESQIDSSAESKGNHDNLAEFRGQTLATNDKNSLSSEHIPKMEITGSAKSADAPGGCLRFKIEPEFTKPDRNGYSALVGPSIDRDAMIKAMLSKEDKQKKEMRELNPLFNPSIIDEIPRDGNGKPFGQKDPKEERIDQTMREKDKPRIVIDDEIPRDGNGKPFGQKDPKEERIDQAMREKDKPRIVIDDEIPRDGNGNPINGGKEGSIKDIRKYNPLDYERLKIPQNKDLLGQPRFRQYQDWVRQSKD